MKKWITIGVILCLCIALIFIARTEIVRNRIIDFVYNASNGFIEIGDIEGNLLFNIRIYNLKLGEVVEVDTVTLHYSPLSLLLRRVQYLDAGEVIINKPTGGGEATTSFVLPVDVDMFMIRSLKFRAFPEAGEIGLSGVNGSIARIMGGVSITLYVDGGDAMDIHISKADGIITYKDGIVYIKEMWVSTEESRVLVSGKFGGETFVLGIRKLKIALKEFKHLLKEDVSGYLYGSLHLKKEEQLAGKANFTLKDISFRDYIISNGNMEIAFKENVIDLMFKSVKTFGGKIDGIARIKLSPFSYESHMQLSNIDINNAIGDLETSLSGEMSIIGNLDEGKIDLSIAGSVAQGEIESIKGSILFGREIEIENMVINDRLSIFGRISDDKLDLSISSESFDISPFLPITGFLNSEVKIFGKIMHPTLTGSFYIEDFQYKNFQARYVSSNFNIETFKEPFLGNVDFAVAQASSPWVKIDNLEGKITMLDKTTFNIKGDGEDIVFSLIGEMTGENVLLDTIIYSSAGITLSNASPVKLRIELPSVFLDRCIMNIDGGYFECKGRYNPNDMDLVFIGEEVSVTSIWRDVKGRMSMWVELKGNIRSPSIELEQRVVEVFYSGIKIDTISMAAEYSQEMLKIDKCNITIGGVQSELNGYIPMGLFPFSMPEEGMYLEVRLKDLPAQVWKPLRRYVIIQGGRTDVDLVMSGSALSPDITGHIDLDDLSLRAPLYGISLTKLNSSIHFSQDRVNIESFSARSGDGNLKLGGYLIISSLSREDIELSIDFIASDIEFQIPEIEGKVDMDISLSGNLGHPIIKGNVDIKEALAMVTLGPRPTVPLEQEFDLDVTLVTERIWVKSPLPLAINPIPELQNPFLDLELGGTIVMVKRGRDIFFTGAMEVIQGYFYYIDRPFEVTEGNFVFDNIQGIDPQISLEAKSDVIYSVFVEDETQLDTTTIFISLGGRPSQLQFSIYSEPELPLEGIIVMLSLNAPWDEFDPANVSDRLLNLLIRGTILAEVEKMLGVDALRVETVFFGEERRAKITAGKYLSQDLYASYTKDILSPSWSFKTTYRVFKGLSLMGERTEGDEYNVGMEVEVRY
ncbi:translocation/assembly module TamB domain-containing protein [candidate division WOR-3 bacterium]|nr:translocation/assembly module TamB domain-containing protein [candidate division WOR-3 bacterium]